MTNLKLDGVSGAVGNLARVRSDDEKEKVLNWVSSLSFHAKQAETLEGAQAGTGRWFLNDDRFVEWVDSKKSGKSVLWCPGIRMYTS